jgi:ribosomal protein L21
MGVDSGAILGEEIIFDEVLVVKSEDKLLMGEKFL